MTSADQNKQKLDLWELLWKVNQIIIPCGIAWSIWVTNNIFELKAETLRGEKFTKTEAIQMASDIKDWTRSNFSPAVEVSSAIKDIQVNIKSIDNQLESLRLDVAKIQVTERHKDK